MEITTQAEYDAAQAESKALMGKGGRLYVLDINLKFGFPMTDAEREEHATLIARFNEIGAAQRAFWLNR